MFVRRTLLVALVNLFISSAVLGLGDFFVQADGMQMGPTYATFFFQVDKEKISADLFFHAYIVQIHIYFLYIPYKLCF